MLRNYSDPLYTTVLGATTLINIFTIGITNWKSNDIESQGILQDRINSLIDLQRRAYDLEKNLEEVTNKAHVTYAHPVILLHM